MIKSYFRFKQREFYDYENGGSINGNNVNEFINLMWNSTTALGAGTAIGSNNCHYLVIKYNPKGNIPGELTSNVFNKTQGALCNMM